MDGILCRCGTYQRIRAAIKDAQAAGRRGMSRAMLSRRAFLGGAAATGAFVLGTRLVPVSVFSQDALGAGALGAGRLPRRSCPTASCRSSRTDRRWAPASARRCRSSSPTNSTPTGRRVTIVQAHRRQEVRLAEHRRLLLDQGLLRADARGRRHRADDARAGGGRGRGTCRWPKSPRATTRSSTRRAAGRSGSASSSATARTLPVPAAASLQFKKAEAYRYVGKPIPSIDLDDIVKGNGIYGADVDRAGHGVRLDRASARAGQRRHVGRRRGGAQGGGRHATS